MTEEEFRISVEGGIAGIARDAVRRGLWDEAAAKEASRAEFARMLPQGFHTPGHSFCTLVVDPDGPRVGETWFSCERKGGQVHFWVDWLSIDAAHRRQGHATEALRLLGEEAAGRGATRLGLYVDADNEAARALYEKLGFRPTGLRLARAVRPRAP